MIVRTFTATDDAGNSATASKPSPQHHSAGVHLRPCRLHRSVQRDANGRRHASDNCGEVTIGVQRNHRWRCAGNYVIFALHTDDAGNSATASQTITVQDTTAPEFTFVPADYTVEWFDEMPMDDATASDNCGEVTIEVSSETTAGDAAGNYVIVRTFTATDDAGNSATFTNHHRTPAPEFTFVPADYSSVQTRCHGRRHGV